MTTQNSNPEVDRSEPRRAQPEEMKTKAYVYGVETLDGDDAWALFEASTTGDVSQVKSLLAKDRRLVNAQCCYQFPIHRAVSAGHAEIVELLLDHGADPGQSRYLYDSWDNLLLTARNGGHREVESLLVRAMEKRFNYTPEFDRLKDAIIARDAKRISEVLRQQPALASASDVLGNNALHWSVITRQLSLIERFVALGTPVEAPRADGQTPLLLAVSGASDSSYRETRDRSHPSLRNTSVLVGSLLVHGASYTISVAAAIGDQERIEQLIHTDADSARRLDSARISPLSRAARSGYLHIVRLLLDHGADPNTPEECAPEGRALYEACCANHLPIAQLLLDRGANPNAGVDSCECCLTIGEIYHGEQARPLQELLRKNGAYLPPYRMDAEQLKQAIREQHEVIRHDEFLRCVMENCDAELLDLLLDSDPTMIERLQDSGELAELTEPALIVKLLSRGLDPNRPDWLGKTLLQTWTESGDPSLASLFLNARKE